MRPLVATVDLTALRHNYLLAKQCAPQRKAFAVVKANAYGHGAPEAVTALREIADGFAVACLEEAEVIRGCAPEARILLLEGCFEPSEYLRAAELGLDIAVQDARQADWLLAADLARPLNVWLKLDSGMHRLGFSVDGLRECHARLKGAAQVGELNLISHFACADERGHALTETQLERYAELLELPFEHCSLANSAAVLTLPQAHMAWIRPGIMLYGATPFAELSARFNSPAFATWVCAGFAGLFYVVTRLLSENALWDTITALGLMICFYYGITALACVWYFRREWFTSVGNALTTFLFPLIGGLVLLVMFCVTALDSTDPDYGSGSSVFGVGTVFILGMGVLAIGVVLMMWTRLRHPAYFRGETLPQTDSTRPIPIIRPDDDGTAVVRDPNERTHS